MKQAIPEQSAGLRGQRVVERTITTVDGDAAVVRADPVVVEEPLELRVSYFEDGRRTEARVVITLRTPGDDVELALGFLFAEDLVPDREAVEAFQHSGPTGGKRANRNVLTIRLKPGAAFDPARLDRNFVATSACGLCGKASLEALRRDTYPDLPAGTPRLTPTLVRSLAPALADVQAVFNETGGLHAAALFDGDGTLRTVREDVGRHNAVDKVIGHYLFARQPEALRTGILLVSGRAGFELVQKAARAGIPVMAAVGAPSSLAVELAAACGLTLLGFVRGPRFNVYHDAGRLTGLA